MKTRAKRVRSGPESAPASGLPDSREIDGRESSVDRLVKTRAKRVRSGPESAPANVQPGFPRVEGPAGTSNSEIDLSDDETAAAKTLLGQALREIPAGVRETAAADINALIVEMTGAAAASGPGSTSSRALTLLNGPDAAFYRDALLKQMPRVSDAGPSSGAGLGPIESQEDVHDRLLTAAGYGDDTRTDEQKAADFNEWSRSIFGEDIPPGRIESMQQRILEGDTSWLPEMKPADHDPQSSLPRLPDGARGAYAHDTQEIFVDQGLSPEEQAAVYAEELGHFLDDQLRSPPGEGIFATEMADATQTWRADHELDDRTPVDEGALFRSALENGEITDAARRAAVGNNDSGVVTMPNGTKLAVELQDDAGSTAPARNDTETSARPVPTNFTAHENRLVNDIRGATTTKGLEPRSVTASAGLDTGGLDPVPEEPPTGEGEQAGGVGDTEGTSGGGSTPSATGYRPAPVVGQPQGLPGPEDTGTTLNGMSLSTVEAEPVDYYAGTDAASGASTINFNPTSPGQAPAGETYYLSWKPGEAHMITLPEGTDVSMFTTARQDGCGLLIGTKNGETVVMHLNAQTDKYPELQAAQDVLVDKSLQPGANDPGTAAYAEAMEARRAYAQAQSAVYEAAAQEAVDAGLIDPSYELFGPSEYLGHNVVSTTGVRNENGAGWSFRFTDEHGTAQHGIIMTSSAGVGPLERTPWGADLSDPSAMRSGFRQSMLDDPAGTLAWARSASPQALGTIVGEDPPGPMTEYFAKAVSEGDEVMAKYCADAGSLAKGEIQSFKFLGNDVYMSNGEPVIKVGSMEIGVSGLDSEGIGLKIFGDNWDFSMKIPISGGGAKGAAARATLEYFSTAETVLGRLGQVAAVAAVAEGLYYAAEGNYEMAGECFGGLAGSIAGAEAGATMGAAFGPVGALAGGVLGGVLGGIAGVHLGGAAGQELMTQTFNPEQDPQMNNLMYNLEIMMHASVLEQNATQIFDNNGVGTIADLQRVRSDLQSVIDQGGELTEDQMLMYNACGYFLDAEHGAHIGIWDRIKHPRKQEPPNAFTTMEVASDPTGEPDGNFTMADLRGIQGYAQAHVRSPTPPTEAQVLESMTTVTAFMHEQGMNEITLPQMAQLVMNSDSEEVKNAFAQALWHVHDPTNWSGPVSLDFFGQRLERAKAAESQAAATESLGGDPLAGGAAGTGGTATTAGNRGAQGMTYNPVTGEYYEPTVNQHNLYATTYAAPENVKYFSLPDGRVVQWYDNPPLSGGPQDGHILGGLGGGGAQSGVSFGMPGYSTVPDLGIAFRILPPGVEPHPSNSEESNSELETALLPHIDSSGTPGAPYTVDVRAQEAVKLYDQGDDRAGDEAGDGRLGWSELWRAPGVDYNGSKYLVEKYGDAGADDNPSVGAEELAAAVAAGDIEISDEGMLRFTDQGEQNALVWRNAKNGLELYDQGSDRAGDEAGDGRLGWGELFQIRDIYYDASRYLAEKYGDAGAGDNPSVGVRELAAAVAAGDIEFDEQGMITVTDQGQENARVWSNAKSAVKLYDQGNDRAGDEAGDGRLGGGELFRANDIDYNQSRYLAEKYGDAGAGDNPSVGVKELAAAVAAGDIRISDNGGIVFTDQGRKNALAWADDLHHS